MKSPLTLLQSLLADVGRFDPSVRGLDRDYQTIEGRTEHEGIGFITITLGKFGDHFDQWLAKRTVETVPGFRKASGSPLPAFLQGLVSLVFDFTTGALKEDRSVSAIKSIRQICRFFKKSQIEESADKLHYLCLKDFTLKENETRGIDPSVLKDLHHASTYILRTCQGSLPDDLWNKPKHGPGAVCEKVAGNQKWSLLTDQIEEYDLFPESEFDLLLVERDKGNFSQKATMPSESSRFVSVPKSVTARRGITVEPLMKQFYQQAFNSHIRKAIERCPIMRTSLDLTDQSKNQQLALSSSIDGKYATIDLSAASDLLSLQLVEAVFHQHQPLLQGMIRCRSLFSNKEMRKFAGMGNATTFPVQSIVFAVLANIAICKSLYKRLSAVRMKRVARLVRVFGDDIIVPTDHAQAVVTLLETCGLKVNHSKSFFEGNFRESCGYDCFDGVLVTPVYYRLDPRLTSWTTSQLETLVSTSNQLWLEGYYSLSDTIKMNVEKQFGKLPNCLRDSGVVGWQSRHRVLLKTKVDKKLHRLLTKAVVSVPQKRKDPLDSYPALFKFFLTALIERPKDHLKRSVQRYSNQVRWRWVPVFPVTSKFLP